MESLRPLLAALNLILGIFLGLAAGFQLVDQNYGWFIYDFIFSVLNFAMFVYWIDHPQ